MTATEKHRSVVEFEKSLRAVEGVRYRATKGLLTGRNGRGTDGTLRLHLRWLHELVAQSDEVCEALDSSEKLAFRYRRAERYVVLGEWLS